MNAAADGLAPAEDCNCVYLPYCDGASFSGHREDPWPVPGGNATLAFRGLANLDATLADALARLGLKDATELVVSGSSAGGLATFVHADHVVEVVRAAAPKLAKAHAAPVVGYFLDHGTAKGPADYPQSYPGRMKYVFGMQGVGASGAIPDACLRAFSSDPHLCFLAPHLVPYVETPLFAFNSFVDQWQLQNELQSGWATKEQQDAVVAYGRDFLGALGALAGKRGSGAFITSCICHGCEWDKLALQGKTAYQWYAAWAAGRLPGPDAVVKDGRGPNGDGAIQLPTCAAFPGLLRGGDRGRRPAAGLLRGGDGGRPAAAAVL